MSTIQIKGGSIRSKLEYVRQHFGDEGEEKLSRLLKDTGNWPVLEANWYAYELFDQVLRCIADSFYEGELGRLKDVGRFSAHHALTGVYQSFRRSNIQEFLHRLPSLHGRYYSAGRADVLKATAKGFRVCVTAPQLFESDQQVACGFYQGAAEVMGHKNVRGRFEIRDGRAYHLVLWRVDPPT